MKLEKSTFFNEFVRNIDKHTSFTLTGLTSFSRLLLLKYIKEISNKKILFITSTEQTALRYSTDLERLFSFNSKRAIFRREKGVTVFFRACVKVAKRV